MKWYKVNKNVALNRYANLHISYKVMNTIFEHVIGI